MSKNVIRNHKDSLFQLAFRDNPEAALSLYNAINGSHHTDATKLKFELLGGEKVILRLSDAFEKIDEKHEYDCDNDQY